MERSTDFFRFKQPSKLELDHDFLWRTTRALPERGRIGIFNRSYYEETLVVRVHPEYLESQRLSIPSDLTDLWQQRFASIRQFEQHLALNGTVILKWIRMNSHSSTRCATCLRTNKHRLEKSTIADILLSSHNRTQ